MEKANIVPIHKKDDKRLVKKYRPVPSSQFLTKYFESLIFDDLSKYFKKNNLFLPQQSGFIPGYLCVQQLISVNHMIYKAYDCSPSLQVPRLFLNISKAFDQVWHDGLLIIQT